MEKEKETNENISPANPKKEHKIRKKRVQKIDEATLWFHCTKLIKANYPEYSEEEVHTRVKQVDAMLRRFYSTQYRITINKKNNHFTDEQFANLVDKHQNTESNGIKSGKNAVNILMKKPLSQITREDKMRKRI